MAKVSDFFENTTKVFSGVITHNASNPDTTNDTVTFMLKQDVSTKDGNALINVDAASLGAGGIFTITLTAAKTKVAPKAYHYEIVWYLSGGTEHYVLDQDIVTVKSKLQDNI